MKFPSPKLFWQTFIGFSLVLSLLALYQTYRQVEALDVVFWRSKWVFLIASYILNLLVGIWFFWKISQNGTADRFDAVLIGMPGRVVLAPVFISGGLLIVWFVRWKIFYATLPQAFPSLWLFWWGSLVATLGLKWLVRGPWATIFASVLLLQGTLFVSYGRLRFVTDYPFSVGYSEASRYYYASLPFAKSLYGIQPALSFLHPTRYFLMAIPFLIKGLPLWVERLWQALLWIGLTAGSAYVLARRLRFGQRGFALLCAAWFFVYCFQGMVYYHLQVMVTIILLGVWPRHFWRSLIAVLLASFWAGISRINWFPVPAMLAIALHFLEEPVSTYKNLWQYVRKPALWAVLGVMTALLSQAWYIVWSGNSQNPEVFGSSFHSPLLWYRLFPNASYALGILPGILIVSAPLWLTIYFAVRGGVRNVHWLRWLGLLSMTLVLFAGGLVVSVKIGGGAELHNMDAYMIMLGVVAVYFFGDQVAVEKKMVAWGKISWPVIVLAVMVPIGFAITNVAPYGTYDRTIAETDLQTLRQMVTRAAENRGEVLFISERQLLTFSMIQGVPLVPQYELVTLMEMAMSHNMDYLNQFYDDLHRHRFVLIVARKQGTSIQDTEESFADENNAWTTMIATQLLCEYEPILTLKSANIQVYAPRSGVRNCP